MFLKAKRGKASNLEKKEKQTVVLACSGIGKAFGTVSRLAALKTKGAKVRCLAAVDVEGSDARNDTKSAEKVITIDGCPRKCAHNIAARARGNETGIKSVLVWAECKKSGLKPDNSVLDVGEGGRKLAKKIAEETSAVAEGD